VADDQEDLRDVRPAREAPDDLGAVHVREAEVEYEQVGSLGGRDGERFLPRARLGDVVAVRRQGRPERAEDLRLVVDDEDAGHGPAPASATAGAGGGWT